MPRQAKTRQVSEREGPALPPLLSQPRALRRLAEDPCEDFHEWEKREKAYRARKLATRAWYCKARKYVCPNGLYAFCRDILGYSDLYPALHKRMCDHATNPEARYTMALVWRGALKSSIGTIGYALQLVAREITLFGTCNIRILIASESLEIAAPFAASITRLMEFNEDFIALYGQQKSEHRTGRQWKETAATSRLRTNHALKEPTISTAAIDAPRHSRHYDVILADDLEAETSSATMDQIDKVWDFYRLLAHSLLEPAFQDGNPMQRVLPAGPRFAINATRWHPDDIYERILKETGDDDEAFRYRLLHVPVVTEAGGYQWPARFDEKKCEQIRRRVGPYLWSCQYLLEPMPEENRTFRKSQIRYLPDEVITGYAKIGQVYIGTDWAYTEKAAIGRNRGAWSRAAAHTVHLVGVFDEHWNLFVLSGFRAQCTKQEGISALFKLWDDYGAVRMGHQRHDRSQIEETLQNYMREQRHFINYEYISYPPDQRKDDRISWTLQPMFARAKIFIAKELTWLEQELLDFPRTVTKDALDALCNLVKVGHPPIHSRDGTVREGKAATGPRFRPDGRMVAHGNGSAVKRKKGMFSSP